ncbi:MAG: 2-oxoglutaramate amidase [Alphaproteobacteria bacterium MarineAlpha5_Bin5]|nr:MAG: 2-oxoglutaramate amidase [Alphaproteobacteria bacterium MarineAlpha5_Bin5]PPR51944.1 MAG: 2-oxoglutaramate amidase [Alphaproteobacteria bacterium MarineAlpha5_Bin4]|tara:strand:- start:25762 stop:26568 length:807 start_codon:yes stop_codon:yes gene_type:complete
MQKIKITQIQFQAKSTPSENAILLESYFQKTITFKPDLICTPECSNIITNDKKYLFDNSTYQKNCPILNMAKSFAKSNNVYVNIGSLLLKKRNQKKLVNRSIMINQRGEIEKTYDKIHMFDVNINQKETHRESESFSSGNKIVIISIKKIKVGFTICYDLRFPNLFRKLAKKGAKIILIPSAFTVPSGRAHWEILVKARAIENSVFTIATNMCGTHHTKRKTYGHSLLINPWGITLARGKNTPVILNSTIDISEVTKVRKKIPAILNY